MAGAAPLTPLGIAVLSLLAERPMHPYEMYQLLMARHEDRLVKVRPGTLNHAVGRLEEQGLVAATGTDREGNRPERTTYAISAAGREALTERLQGMLATPVNEYPAFPLAVSEAYNLPAGVVIDLLDQRLNELEGQLKLLFDAEERVRGRGLDRKYWIDMQYQQTMLNAEIGWIRSLQEQLGSGQLPW
ncbi:DNA-binding PadR family transcriptional regulator [Arthrobacter sp. V4I6]|uniref:PadR family transcriptional regulator n=1 Tax=unclassified Arthrobacter TaxID=235627 RepID=UPI0027854BB5|nr:MULTISPECIES: PadR family transcriptional regulator [unclassified Arthrobacter]MDQ0819926.1 DNA-binding PadR family transcriptional regulator [Arthrobacter sp. V1I7]MDQ0854108.1 DNA-binding PadR family transcriptional regulator [Arthrobacter sp. V4I6]